MTDQRARLSSCFKNATLTLLITVVFLAVAGCANTEDPAGDPASDPTGEPEGEPEDLESEAATFPVELQTISLTSPTFGDADSIPPDYTCEGDDVSPPLEWTGVPEAAGSIVLLCEDFDAPGGAFVHWVCFTQETSPESLPEFLPEDAFGEAAVDTVWTAGENDYATLGYRGPCPPEGLPHRYLFRVIAVEGQLNLSEGASIDDVLLEVEQRVLAWGALTAMFGTSDEPNPFAPADTSSPRATLMTFIDGCNKLQQVRLGQAYLDKEDPELRALVKRILDCFDASELPEFARVEALGEVALCLKEVLDRVEFPLEHEIPGPEDLKSEEGELLDRWQVPGTRIVIGRVESGPQKHEYVFTPGTVARAVENYEDMAELPYRGDGPKVSPGLYYWYVSVPGNATIGYLVDWLPDWTRKRILKVAIWQWLALAIEFVLAVLLFALAYRLQRTLARRFLETSLVGYFLTLLIPLVAVLIPVGFKLYATDHLRIRGTALYAISFAADMVTLLAMIVVIFTVANRVTESIIVSPKINPKGLDAQFIRIVSRLAALVVSVVIFLEGGRYLGIPLTTLLASAGVGGLSVALAAQDTVKNLFGTITLMADKPFRIGERIILKEYDGVVENIGLRSTRIRLLNGHQVTVPNDELARSDIENVGRRPFIKRVADFHIPLDTPAEKVDAAVTILRTALENHEGMVPDYPPRVFFVDILPSAFAIRVIYWFHPPKYWDYLAFSEKFNFEVFRALEEQGISFSLPHRLTHTSLESKPAPIDVRLQGEGADSVTEGLA